MMRRRHPLPLPFSGKLTVQTASVYTDFLFLPSIVCHKRDFAETNTAVLMLHSLVSQFNSCHDSRFSSDFGVTARSPSSTQSSDHQQQLLIDSGSPSTTTSMDYTSVNTGPASVSTNGSNTAGNSCNNHSPLCFCIL